MTFQDLPAGSAVFLDANTLVYARSNHPQWGPFCDALLGRISRQELLGFTSTHVLSEAAHRLMALEVMRAHNRPQTGIALWMRNHPAVVQSLRDFRPAIESVAQGGVQVVMPLLQQVEQALAISQQTGLLHNDALIVAVMQAHGLTNLASSDPDFDGVSGITRYSPG